MSFSQHSNEYRPHIDGLRALAILPVVLFHAGVAGFGGGYVGVDIFFVISGYLITGHILSSLYQGSFSFCDFYGRRARRILPALIAAVIVTLVASFYLLMPGELAEAGKAARHVVYFFSNHYFWGQENDFWDQNALSTQPLLHTWSLAVGAQFYIVLPCLLVLVFRFGRRAYLAAPTPMWVVRSVLVGLAMVSFAVSGALLQVDQAAAFYLLPSRAWELLFGSIIASLAGTRLSRPPLWFAEICSIVGLICILWGVLTYTQATPFPATHALVPVAGAGLILYSGYSHIPTWMTRLLSLRVLVFVGLISYSLYLWHWPLLVLFRSTVWSVKGLPQIPVLGYLAIALVVSWVSWALIERPFRTGFLAAARSKTILGVALVASLTCFGAGVWAIQASRTDQQDLPPVLTQLDQDMDMAPGIACEGKPELDVIRAGQSGCVLGDPAVAAPTPDFILLGDSHARMWVSAFDTLARELDLHGVAMAYANCVPLKGAVPPTRPACTGITDAALEYVARSPVQQVILAGYWIEAAETAFAKPSMANGVQMSTQNFNTSLRDTIRYLQQAGKAVTLILDVPQLENDDVPRDLALLSVSQQGANTYGPSLAEHVTRQKPMLEGLEEVWPDVKPFGVVDPTVGLCAAGQCLVAREGRTWYHDKQHLTDDAARELRAVFLPLLRSVSAPR